MSCTAPHVNSAQRIWIDVFNHQFAFDSGEMALQPTITKKKKAPSPMIQMMCSTAIAWKSFDSNSARMLSRLRS